jgi:ABC-type uncharacterized transport system permease subunit
MIPINKNPSQRQLTVFGGIWLVFFGFFGAWTLWRGGSQLAGSLLLSAAVAVPAIGRLSPKFLRLVFLGMSYATYPIGLVVSLAIMLVMYYLVVTPIGLLMRLLGHDPMQRRFDRGATSYWIERPTSAPSARQYFRQY